MIHTLVWLPKQFIVWIESSFIRKVFLIFKIVGRIKIVNFLRQYYEFHRKLTAACQTKAKRRKKRGITGITSTIGFKKA